MIVRDRPSAFRLFFILRGSVVHKVYPQILCATLIALAVDFYHQEITARGLTLTAVPFSLMGLALAIFLGFKNTAAYERFWEARKLWGELLISSRSFARQVLSYLPGDEVVLQDKMIRQTIAFAYSLRDHLRASIPEAPHKPDAILRTLGLDLRNCLIGNKVPPQLIQTLDLTLDSFARVLGGCERIRSTPIPFSYTLLLHRTAYAYCFLLPFGLVDTVGLGMPIVVALVSYTFFALEALGDELEEPFGTSANDLPLSAICRQIEISLLEALGEKSIPSPLKPEGFQLD